MKKRLWFHTVFFFHNAALIHTLVFFWNELAAPAFKDNVLTFNEVLWMSVIVGGLYRGAQKWQVALDEIRKIKPHFSDDDIKRYAFGTYGTFYIMMMLIVWTFKSIYII